MVGLVPEWTLGERLRKAREEAGLDRDEMAARMQVSERTLRNWERDANLPRYSLLIAKEWAEITQVDLAWLRGES